MAVAIGENAPLNFPSFVMSIVTKTITALFLHKLAHWKQWSSVKRAYYMSSLGMAGLKMKSMILWVWRTSLKLQRLKNAAKLKLSWL